MVLVVSETGLVHTFSTPKLENVVKSPEGQKLITESLINATADQNGMFKILIFFLYPYKNFDSSFFQEYFDCSAIMFTNATLRSNKSRFY